MALDGLFMSMLRHEIEEIADGARIDRIAQPSRDEIILHLRSRSGGGKLLLSANPGSARAHFTSNAPENPPAPPMFCMLLRKHLSSAKLLAVRQVQTDRILHFDFESRNELGDMVTITIAVEIMGRHSNIIVIDGDGMIIDSIKRVDPETSSVRLVLPGMRYALPPAQDKLSLPETDIDEIMRYLEKARPIELSKALIETLQGISPIVSREIAHFACRGIERQFQELDENGRERLKFYLSGLKETVTRFDITPTMVIDSSMRPKDFSFIQINQYGTSMTTKEYATCSELLDAFYARRDKMERMKQRSSDLLRLLANRSDRIARKLAAQREELAQCGERGTLRLMGDLVSSSLHTIKKGDTKINVPNYFDPDSGDIEIELDPMLTPPQNAQKYYALYRKADTAEKMLIKLITDGESELVYLDSVFDLLARAENEAELDAIRTELADGGYVRRESGKKAKKEVKLPPRKYISTDGFTILSGRGNAQNDRLTMKESRGNDIWLHTQKIPGSHTIIVSNGTDIPKSTIEQACVIAAYNSKARESSRVAVDFTEVRNVKKPNGAKPGMVIYDRYQTVIVDPDEALVAKLASK